MTSTLKRILLLLCSTLCIQDAWCLRNVRLKIEPKVVKRHQHSVLRCEYDLEAEPLYSVKWYRGRHEFYRFTPSDVPAMKIFPLAYITVNLHNSNSTQVMLENIEFNLSGNFSCEVTTDTEPMLSTGMDTQVMLVVQFPEHPPTISVGHEPLDIGDTLRANCSSPPSRPPTLLKFLLNNITVHRSEPMTRRQTQETAWSDLALDLPLSSYHFAHGRLQLSCEAQIPGAYLANATLELESVRDPVPERVSIIYSTASCRARHVPWLALQLITFTYFIIL